MKTLAFPTFLLQEKELKGSFTTLSKRNYFCAKIKHETFQPKIKSDNALGNLITALLQEHSMKAKEEVSVEFCWKLNPVIVSNNSVPDNAISKMQYLIFFFLAMAYKNPVLCQSPAPDFRIQ